MNKLETTFTVDIPDNEKPELFGRIIDIFEDWLTDKGIAPDDIPNPERENDASAIIYGNDYDYLADKIAEALGISR